VSYICKIGHAHGSLSGKRSCDAQTVASIRRHGDAKLERAGIVSNGMIMFHYRYAQAIFKPPLIVNLASGRVRLLLFARGVRNGRVPNAPRAP
jgi:hypothetical protein